MFLGLLKTLPVTPTKEGRPMARKKNAGNIPIENVKHKNKRVNMPRGELLNVPSYLGRFNFIEDGNGISVVSLRHFLIIG